MFREFIKTVNDRVKDIELTLIWAGHGSLGIEDMSKILYLTFQKIRALSVTWVNCKMQNYFTDCHGC